MLQHFAGVGRRSIRFLSSDPLAVRVTKTLITLDVLFILVHGLKYVFKEQFIAQFGYWIYRNLTITNDWAIPEITNYIKFAAIVLLLVSCFRSQRQSIYLAWAFVYLIALSDDSLQLHESLGEYIGEKLAGSSSLVSLTQSFEGVRLQDLGELVVYGAYAVLSTIALAVGFRRTGSSHRGIGLGFGVLFVCLAGFAAGVDMIARLARSHSHLLSQITSSVEDGGEMIVISLTVALAVAAIRFECKEGLQGSMAHVESGAQRTRGVPPGCENPEPSFAMSEEDAV